MARSRRVRIRVGDASGQAGRVDDETDTPARQRFRLDDPAGQTRRDRTAGDFGRPAQDFQLRDRHAPDRQRRPGQDQPQCVPRAREPVQDRHGRQTGQERRQVRFDRKGIVGGSSAARQERHEKEENPSLAFLLESAQNGSRKGRTRNAHGPSPRRQAGFRCGGEIAGRCGGRKIGGWRGNRRQTGREHRPLVTHSAFLVDAQTPQPSGQHLRPTASMLHGAHDFASPPVSSPGPFPDQRTGLP